MLNDRGNPTRALRSINETLLMCRFLVPPKIQINLFLRSWTTRRRINSLVSVASRCLRLRNLSSPKRQSQICFHSLVCGGSVWVVRSIVEWVEFGANIIDGSCWKWSKFYYHAATNTISKCLRYRLDRLWNSVCVLTLIGWYSTDFDLATCLWTHGLSRRVQLFLQHPPIRHQYKEPRHCRP